ncbi:hypothetical protein Taro_022779 [Colocasia esculenta]|uniref:CCHC-type domain-containing protein n=1 Tax=Colocasia esculenta TaxID=4460 RepID=A0A843V8Y0_COLES|nr:hypothetical protein [Colocasia esculenta]
MEYFLQGHDYQIWSIVEEGDLVVTNEKAQWTDEDRKKISLNCKAKSILCCALSKKEFNRVSACKSSMEMWEKLRITYEGTDKVKETRIDILVTQYERFQMQTGESITQMFSRFTDITNGLASLGKSYEIADMVRKILRSLPSSWTPKVTAIEEANDLKRMSVEKLIGSLMAHEINMERLGESSSRKKHSNALKAEEESSEASSSGSDVDSGNEEAMLSKRLQRILAKKKKFQSGRRYFKKNKDSKRSDGKEMKKGETIYYECKKSGHIKADCPMLKKNDHKKKDSSKKFRRYKKKAMAAAWENSSDSDSKSSSSSDGEEANLALMANIEEKNSWGPFILKEIRIAKNFQLYSDFCYLNKLPEVQFYQFHSAIVMLRSEQPINLPLSVDFVVLKVDSPVLLPKLHSLVFDSDAGSHAFDMFAKQMGRMSAKQGRMPSFLQFIFREYHSGCISSQVLAPLISECERLSPTIWETLYKEPHLQLQAINSSLVRQDKPILSAEAFIDLNSINPIQEIYVQWAARYTAFYALKQDLLDQKLFYPISLDRFLHRASFGKSTYFRFILDKDQYEEFLEEQRQLYIQRISPAMGSSFSVVPGVFRQTFEDIEIKAWIVISQHASLLSPLYYLTPN